MIRNKYGYADYIYHREHVGNFPLWACDYLLGECEYEDLDPVQQRRLANYVSELPGKIVEIEKNGEPRTVSRDCFGQSSTKAVNVTIYVAPEYLCEGLRLNPKKHANRDAETDTGDFDLEKIFNDLREYWKTDDRQLLEAVELAVGSKVYNQLKRIVDENKEKRKSEIAQLLVDYVSLLEKDDMEGAGKFSAEHSLGFKEGDLTKFSFVKWFTLAKARAFVSALLPEAKSDYYDKAAKRLELELSRATRKKLIIGDALEIVLDHHKASEDSLIESMAKLMKTCERRGVKFDLPLQDMIEECPDLLDESFLQMADDYLNGTKNIPGDASSHKKNNIEGEDASYIFFAISRFRREIEKGIMVPKDVQDILVQASTEKTDISHKGRMKEEGVNFDSYLEKKIRDITTENDSFIAEMQGLLLVDWGTNEYARTKFARKMKKLASKSKLATFKKQLEETVNEFKNKVEKFKKTYPSEVERSVLRTVPEWDELLEEKKISYNDFKLKEKFARFFGLEYEEDEKTVELTAGEAEEDGLEVAKDEEDGLKTAKDEEENGAPKVDWAEGSNEVEDGPEDEEIDELAFKTVEEDDEEDEYEDEYEEEDGEWDPDEPVRSMYDNESSPYED